MKTTCPACGAVASLDVLLGNDGAREAVMAALEIPAPLGKMLVQYLGLFRPANRNLSFDRVANILEAHTEAKRGGQTQIGGSAAHVIQPPQPTKPRSQMPDHVKQAANLKGANKDANS